MKILIEQTNEVFLLDGVPVRRWIGKIEGIEHTVDVYVHRVGVPTEDLASSFKAEMELESQAAPTNVEIEE